VNPDTPSVSRPATALVLNLFRRSGGSQYGGEAVSQLEHALQAATFAEADGASSPLIAAALLHDIGHLLHELPDDAPEQGIDDQHELLGAAWLEARFIPDVVEPVKLHVAAKRYLCTVDPSYHSRLSPPSVTSLMLQGGPMSSEEVLAFDALPFAADAVRLRQWDEAAKVPLMVTPRVEHFARHLDAACLPTDVATEARS
jgi:[1-hydroxy-2-(trimethylamino)ethyl]phosphonate dioxygenase